MIALEGDPREEISEEDASFGETLKGGSPGAIKDDVHICLILDCCGEKWKRLQVAN